MEPRILITGATGKLGGSVISHLATKIPVSRISALVRDQSKAKHLIEKGIDIRTGDYNDPASLATALKGIDTLFLISASDLSGRFEQHKNVIDAAKANHVKHIIYTGVTINSIDASPLKEFLGEHFQTEEYIKQNGFNYTFLRNGLYAEVIPMFLGDKVLDNGVFFASGKGTVAFASRNDLAEAAANIIASPKNENSIYELTGNSAHSFEDVSRELSELSGKNVPFISPSDEEYSAALKQFGLPEAIVNMSAGFAAAIRNNDFDRTTGTLEKVLGRKPVSLHDFLKQTFIQN